MNQKSLFGLLQSGFIFWVLAGGIWGWSFPDSAAAGAGWISEALMLIMLGMGLTLKLSDIRALRHAGRPLLLGVSLQYLVMPVAAWAIATALHLSPMLALGVILVGCCPGGTASNVVAWLARGDVALSVAMTSLSTLLAPIMTPLWIWMLASTWLDIDPAALFFSVVQIVLLPVAAGIALRSVWKPDKILLSGIFPLLAMLTIAWIVGVVVGINVDRLHDVATPLLLSVVLLNVTGLLLGRIVMLRMGYKRRQARTVAIEVGMQNSGLAVALAIAHFSPEAALAGALFSLWHNVSGALLADYWRRSGGKTKQGDLTHI
ncbi:bile acid:Na+ symporter, BASS family [Mariprofundus ferrinatatus]|uniref:Bile acid:Na+ symporter, BASS family n=1 Tax=Mariprofundus ferrinatatus TaxID=1921087 RepID=A0A2K8LB48_9PROT|nr:bile acid:sodium symporter family protein [Mariprofundus ferrinatatus]ATX81476.1 bile acid:Na+ symporter, BASS family [Mariprofundus ferrinatatus]